MPDDHLPDNGAKENTTTADASEEMYIRQLRVRKRLVKRKLFIQATYWGHPECAFSRFSGTINTPVKQRVHAFI